MDFNTISQAVALGFESTASCPEKAIGPARVLALQLSIQGCDSTRVQF